MQRLESDIGLSTDAAKSAQDSDIQTAITEDQEEVASYVAKSTVSCDFEGDDNEAIQSVCTQCSSTAAYVVNTDDWSEVGSTYNFR